MISAKQKNIRVFEIVIDDRNEFFEYINKNLVLLKRFVLLLNGAVDEEIVAFLTRYELEFAVLNRPLETQSRERKDEIIEQTKAVKTIALEEIKSEDIKDDSMEETLVFDRTIRSGESIESENDILIFGRINGGATVKCKKNIIILGEIEGKVVCEGGYALVGSFGNGSLNFCGEVFDKSNIDGKNRIVYKHNEKLEVREI